MQLEDEFGNDAEVRAAAADAEEKVGVLSCTGVNVLAVSENQMSLYNGCQTLGSIPALDTNTQQIVERQAMKT